MKGKTEIATDYGDRVARVVVRSLPVAGTYTVSIDSQYSDQTSPYEVSLMLAPGPFVVPSGDQGGALVNGVSQTGEATLGDVDPWTLTASPGDNVLVSAGELSAPTSFSPWFAVVAPDGAVVLETSNEIVASGMFTATQAGTYTVIVGALSEASTGSYRLTMVRVPGTTPPPPGDQGGPLQMVGTTAARSSSATWTSGHSR